MGKGKSPNPAKFRLDSSRPILGLRVESSVAGSSGPAMPRSRAQLKLALIASSRSALLKTEWLQLNTARRSQLCAPVNSDGSPIRLPGQLRNCLPDATPDSEMLEPLP